MTLPSIGVVVPTYLGGSSLREAISSVRAAEKIAQARITIVVVDNHPCGIDKRYSEQADHYISLRKNPGFGAACNSGISFLLKQKNLEFILLLNPDAVLECDFFLRLTQQMQISGVRISWPVMPLISYDFKIQRIKIESIFQNQNEVIEIVDLDDIFIVFDHRGSSLESFYSGSKRIFSTDFLTLRPQNSLPKEIYFRRSGSKTLESLPIIDACVEEDRIVQNAGGVLTSSSSAGDRNAGWLTSAAAQYLGGPGEAWCGAAVILPREYIVSLGGFDETFFLYYEDTELSLRGWKSGILPQLYTDLRVVHKHSGITGRFPLLRQREIWKSRVIFTRRANGVRHAIGFILLEALKYLIMLITLRISVRHFLKSGVPEILFGLIGLLKSFYPRRKFRHLEIL